MAGRGESVITLPDGEEITILFTNQALGEFQQRTGTAAMALLFQAERQNIGQVEIANLLRAGMTAANRANGSRKEAASLKQAYDIMDSVGFIPVMEIVIGAVADVLTYRGDSESDPN